MGVSTHLLQGWSNDQPRLPQEHREGGNAESRPGARGLRARTLKLSQPSLAGGWAPRPAVRSSPDSLGWGCGLPHSERRGPCSPARL